MLTIHTNQTRGGNPLSRRKLLEAGGAGLFGLSLPKLLTAESAIDPITPKAKSVIFLFLFGGPSQLETFDLKPDAPSQIRGPFTPIACRTPGLIISEHLPKTARLTDKLCVVRTLTHDFNDHSGGAHYIQTGKRWHVPIGGGFSPTPKDWPSMGSIVEYADQQRNGLAQPLPAYAVLPNSLGALQEAGQYPRPGEYAGWLGQRYNPLTSRIGKKSLADNPYWRDCADDELHFQPAGLNELDGITLERMANRKSLLEQFSQEMRRFDVLRTRSGLDQFRERAFSLVSSPKTREALDIRREPNDLRERYGKHLFGQSCLMARRLIEAGVRFVTVHYDCVDGYSWDSHRNSDDVKRSLLPTFDQAYSALIEDLDSRGMLEETLVVATGEMGRTPKANAQWGRDHWSTLFSAVLAGGGAAKGLVYGKSDKDAAYALENPVTPEDLAATIYSALGIDPQLRLLSPDGRPTPIVDGGSPISAILGG